ncbi:MAG: hypothetical protein ACJ72Q_15810 [Nitrososphaeraceae archaeon]
MIFTIRKARSRHTKQSRGARRTKSIVEKSGQDERRCYTTAADGIKVIPIL